MLDTVGLSSYGNKALGFRWTLIQSSILTLTISVAPQESRLTFLGLSLPIPQVEIISVIVKSCHRLKEIKNTEAECYTYNLLTHNFFSVRMFLFDISNLRAKLNTKK
jgi:hypothetical protein